MRAACAAAPGWRWPTTTRSAYNSTRRARAPKPSRRAPPSSRSPDRAFLDNVVTDTIAPEGGGRWVRNPGGYSDWKRLTEARAQAARQPEAGAKAAPSREKAAPQRSRKLGFNQARELELMPARIQA